jgi:hypothetical protein
MELGTEYGTWNAPSPILLSPVANLHDELALGESLAELMPAGSGRIWVLWPSPSQPRTLPPNAKLPKARSRQLSLKFVQLAAGLRAAGL